MQRGLYDNYYLKTVNFPFTLYGTVPKGAVFPLVTIRHNTVLKPNIPHYNSDNSKATSSFGYILRQNDELKQKYITFIMWVLNIIHCTGRIKKKRI